MFQAVAACSPFWPITCCQTADNVTCAVMLYRLNYLKYVRSLMLMEINECLCLLFVFLGFFPDRVPRVDPQGGKARFG